MNKFNVKLQESERAAKAISLISIFIAVFFAILANIIGEESYQYFHPVSAFFIGSFIVTFLIIVYNLIIERFFDDDNNSAKKLRLLYLLRSQVIRHYHSMSTCRGMCSIITQMHDEDLISWDEDSILTKLIIAQAKEEDLLDKETNIFMPYYFAPNDKLSRLDFIDRIIDQLKEK